MYEQCKVLQARFDIIKTIKNKEDWVVSKLRDKLADFLSHPKTTQILGVIKFLKSPKGFWSVAYLLTAIISLLLPGTVTALIVDSDAIEQGVKKSNNIFIELWWVYIKFFHLNDSYIYGLVFITFIVFLLLWFSFLHYYEIKKAPSNNHQVDFFVKELGRKNQEIDELKAKLKETTSESDRIALTRDIKELQTELDQYKEKITALEDAIAKAKNIKVVQEATEMLNASGIDVALEYFESIDFDSHLQQSIEYSKALLVQAELYTLKNDHTKANNTYQKSIELNRNFDNSLAYANYLTKQNKHKKAIVQLQLIMQILNLSDEQKSGILNNLANLYQNQNRLPEAEKYYNEALEIIRGLAIDNPDVYNHYVAMTLNNLAVLYQSQNRLPEAETACNEALKIRRDLAKDNPGAYNPDVATTLNNLALLYQKQKKLVEAETAYNKALEIIRDLVKDNPSVYNPILATTLQNLAVLHRKQKRLTEAQTAYNEALQIRRNLANDNPNAFGINYAQTIIMGVELFGHSKTNLSEAVLILQQFKGNQMAKQLMGLVYRLRSQCLSPSFIFIPRAHTPQDTPQARL